MTSNPTDYKNITIRELAGIISQAFQDNDMEAVLVGGACVSIYTQNKYQSYDLDFITYETRNKFSHILKNLGFQHDSRKYFTHPQCPFLIEFLAPPIAIGNEPVSELNSLKTKTGVIKLLSPTDCVKDRLATYFHWDDTQSLDQAVMVSKSQKIDLKNIKQWAKQEEHVAKLDNFLKKV